MMRKIISGICILAAFVGILPGTMVTATKEDNVVAQVDFAAVSDKTGFSTVKFATNSATNNTQNVVVADGNTCWQMTGSGQNGYIAFDIASATLSKITDGSEYSVVVEYYDGDRDSTDVGFFSLEYDAVSSNRKLAEMVILENSGEWKTKEFKLHDAYFGTRLARHCDFRLTVVPQNSTTYDASVQPVLIKSVKLIKTGIIRTIKAESNTEQPGNTFEWYKKEKIIKNTFTNIGTETKNVEITYRAVSEDGNDFWSNTETYTFSGGETKEVSITLPDKFSKCGLYDWYIDVSGDCLSTTKTMRFAVIKTDENGIKNEDAYMAQHLTRNTDDDTQLSDGLDLIKMSNSAGYRADLTWQDIENATGQLVFSGTEAEKLHNYAKENDLKVLWTISPGNYYITGGWNKWPTTDDLKIEFKDYVRFATEKVKDTAIGFELGNELDNKYFNPDHDGDGKKDVTPLMYADFLKMVDEITDVTAPDVPLHGYSLTWLPEWLVNEWVVTGINAGVLDYLDYVSYHPYISDSCVENSNKITQAKSLNNIVKAADESAGLSITEVGITLADGAYVNGRRSQGANQVRLATAYKARGLADFVTHFVFEEIGQIGSPYLPDGANREDGFGMVSSGKAIMADESGAVYVPNESFVSYTAMNYVLAQSKPWGTGVYDLSENITALGFESEKFNSKILVLSTSDFPEDVTLDLGVKEITVYDDYGNESVMKSLTGNYGFSLNERPVYVVGDIKTVNQGDDTLSWFAEAGNDENSLVINFSHSVLELEKDSINLLNLENLETCEDFSQSWSDDRKKLYITMNTENKMGAEYKVTISGYGETFANTGLKHDKVLLAEDFSENSGWKQQKNADTDALLGPENGIWYQDVAGYWGFGTYAAGEKLRVDNAQSSGTTDTTVKAVANVGISSENKKKIDIEFDMGYYQSDAIKSDVHGEPDYGYGAVYILGNQGNLVPMLRIGKANIGVDDDWGSGNLIISDKEINKNDLTKPNHYKCSFDIESKKVTYYCNGTEIGSRDLKHNYINIINSGIEKIAFGTVMKVALAGDPSAHRMEVDNFKITAELENPEYFGVQSVRYQGIEGLSGTYSKQNHADYNLLPTTDRITINFSSAVSEEMLRDIQITDRFGKTINYTGELSQDKTLFTIVTEPLKSNGEYRLKIPNTVSSEDGILADGDYSGVFGTKSSLRFEDGMLKILAPNPKNADGICYLIPAVYENGVFKSAELIPIEYKKGLPIVYEMNAKENTSFYLWDSIDNISPLDYKK